MPYEFFFVDDFDIVVTYASGVLLPEEVFEGLSELARSPRYTPTIDRVLVFDDNTDLTNFDANKLKELILNPAVTAGEFARVSL